MNKQLLKLTVIEQRETFDRHQEILHRHADKKVISNKKITVITGIRRSGKSTLLKQISSQYDGFYYLNFEDDRLLDFTYHDFNTLLEVFAEIYNEQRVFFFDEIQNIAGWEKFASRLFREGYKVFVTGSNAKLLSSEIATSLSGRNQTITLYPFSFREYLEFHKHDIKDFYTTKERAKVKKHFNAYLKFGGFPEVVINQNKNELIQLYSDILIKDLLVRFNIRDKRAFKELALYLLSNVGKGASFNNLKKVLEINSVTTVKNYFDHLEESFLVAGIYKFDYSLKKQMINERKIYGIDTGLISAVSFSFSENSGRLLENIVYIELMRRKKEVYYYMDKNECDFVIKQGTRIQDAIQVTKSISKHNQEREVQGLVNAMKTYKLKTGTILTLDSEEELKIDNMRIKVLPIWKWLIG